MITGPAVLPGAVAGGALVGVLSAVGTVVVDALSFLFSALAVRRLRSPEPPPPRRDPTASRGAQLTAGLTFVREHSDLRRMLVSWVVFAGAVMTASPLTMLFYLRELGFTPWVFVLAGGLLATVLSTRSTLVLAAALMLRASPAITRLSFETTLPS